MEITKSLLLNGKPTLIKDKEYLSTREYVEPFLNEMSKYTDNFVINVTLPSQITLTNKEEDITFNRVWIQAIIPSSDDIKEVINLTYALDVKKPCYKVFRTYMENDCHYVFNSNWIFTDEIKDQPFKLPIKELMEMENSVPMVLSNIKKKFVDDEFKYDFLGKLLEKSILFEYNSISGKVKLSPSVVIKMHENIYLDSTSKSYKKDQEATVFDLYSEILTVIKDGYKRDPINVFEKSLLAAQILNII